MHEFELEDVSAPARTPEGDRRVAYHEGGHAVVQHLSRGRRIAEVSIEPDGTDGSAGHCTLVEDPSAPIAGHEAGLLAGPIAERLVLVGPDDFLWRSWAADVVRNRRPEGSDEARAFGVITHDLRHEGADGEAYAAAVVEAVVEELRGAWPAVEAVAAALLERGTIPGDEAERIIRAALGIGPDDSWV